MGEDIDLGGGGGGMIFNTPPSATNSHDTASNVADTQLLQHLCIRKNHFLEQDMHNFRGIRCSSLFV
ncbi:unnamed protein product, partial [Ixodes pacificus]